MKRFLPRDRIAARKHFGLPQDLFLAAFVGSFCERKGATRVAAALEDLDGTGAIFAGEGDMAPVGSKVVLSRRIPHDEIPLFLSSADIFVLPTQSEGSCNAIVEAMACGLPVISSVGEFNDDLLDNQSSIRVDPMDITAIRSAIAKLRDDPVLRQSMAVAAVKRAKQFDVDERARRVLEFMSVRMG